MDINGCTIGKGARPYIIAEVSGNHNGDISRAKKMIEIAKESGADAVKFQTYDADSLTLDISDERFHLSSGPWAGRSLYDLYTEAATPWEWFGELFEYAHEIGITIFSSPFCARGVALLESLNCPAYKIASNEMTDWPLVKLIAETNKPVIISTGTSSKQEISDTIDFLRRHGCTDLVVLHCISAYPAMPRDSNIQTMVDIRESFNVEVGLSDHTMGVATSIAAVSLGASVIEKHFTISRAEGGVDSHFSLEPEDLKALVNDTKLAWESIGCIRYGNESDLSKRGIFVRQLWAIEEIAPGEYFSEKNVRSIRGPVEAEGLSPVYFEKLYSMRANRRIKCFSPIYISDIKGACDE